MGVACGWRGYFIRLLTYGEMNIKQFYLILWLICRAFECVEFEC